MVRAQVVELGGTHVSGPTIVYYAR